MISPESKDKLQNIENKYQQLVKNVDHEQISATLEDLESQMQDPSFWNNQEEAQRISQQATNLKRQQEQWNSFQETIEYLFEMTAIELNEKDTKEIENEIETLDTNIVELETNLLLSDEYDRSNAIVRLIVGNGGQDAEDFTQMLYRMYLRLSEKKGFHAQILDESNTDDGLKSATILIKGSDAYGMLKSEHGVHRLIRQSPFNSKGLRQTSFSRVEVIPEIQQNNEVHIEEKDLRIDVFRASGNGGQSVNTTDSAVRITYLPLGISVSCQNEKSQLQNKQTALSILTSRLLQLQKEQQVQEMNEIRGDVMENSFGSQIRTYTLHPYKMVKDHRTNYEESNPQKVFDGDLSSFIFEYLQYAAQK